MLQASHPNAFVQVFEWHNELNRQPPVARCLFGKPSVSETQKMLENEIAIQVQRFYSRYEICAPENKSSSQTVEDRLSPKLQEEEIKLVSDRDSRKRSQDAGDQESTHCKRQRLLTDYWRKSKRAFSSPVKSS